LAGPTADLITGASMSIRTTLTHAVPELSPHQPIATALAHATTFAVRINAYGAATSCAIGDARADGRPPRTCRKMVFENRHAGPD